MVQIKIVNVGECALEKCPSDKPRANAKRLKGLVICPPNIALALTADWNEYVNKALAEDFPGWRVKGWLSC